MMMLKDGHSNCGYCSEQLYSDDRGRLASTETVQVQQQHQFASARSLPALDTVYSFDSTSSVGTHSKQRSSHNLLPPRQFSASHCIRISSITNSMPPPNSTKSSQSQKDMATSSRKMSSSQRVYNHVPSDEVRIERLPAAQQPDYMVTIWPGKLVSMKKLIYIAFGLAIATLLLLLIIWAVYALKVATLERTSSDEISAPFLEKTINALKKTSQTIWYKRFGSEEQCLDSSAPNSTAYYLAIPNRKCGSNSSTQQWRLVGDQLQVGETKNYGMMLGLKGSPCLECLHEEVHCNLVVTHCKGSDGQTFYLAMNSDLIDVQRKQVYFTIHNEDHPSQCAAVHHDENYQRDIFHLEECTGANNQLFYLKNVDYSKEFALRYQKLSNL